MKKKSNLGEFIAKAREKLNLSQQDLALICKIPAGTIASIESGYAKSPRSVTLKKLAEGLKIPAEVIFTYASQPETQVFIEHSVNMLKLPSMGQIPSLEEFSFQGNISFPSGFVDEGDFILSINGDCFMDEDLYDNDYIVIKKQETLIKNGDLMVITVNNERTLARIYKDGNSYKVQTGSSQDIVEPQNITFIGKALTSISRKKL